MSRTFQTFAFGAAVVVLGLSQGVADASVISLGFTTIGAFSPGTPPEISYTPTAFSGSTAADGSLALTDLGSFTTGVVTDNVNFNGFLFTLTLNFTSPDGISGTVEFVGNLHGQLHPNGGGGLQIHFGTNNPLPVTYSGASGSGSFNLTVDNIRNLDVGSPQTATGNIAGGVDPPTPTPEPGSLVLAGTALIVISWAVRRRRLPPLNTRKLTGRLIPAFFFLSGADDHLWKSIARRRAKLLNY